MRDAQPDPFVVLGKDSLAGLSPASVGLVRAFYQNLSPLEPRELRALADSGLELLPERGRWLAWSTDEDYCSITVMPRLVRPPVTWEQAVGEAQASLELRAAAQVEEWRRLLAEEERARANHLAAERHARAKGRLWVRWTGGYREARGQLDSMKATHHQARDRAADARGRERATTWLSSQLEERTQIAANVMSRRWTGWSCVGRWEDPISSSDVRKIAAALVIGQATVGLMLSDLISDDVYGRLLGPWHSSVSWVPWQVVDAGTVDD